MVSINDWIRRAWASDVISITRWYVMTSKIRHGDCDHLLLRRVIGWDDSEVPYWVSAREESTFSITCEQRAADAFSLVDPCQLEWFRSADLEVRRIRPEVRSWCDEPSSGTWGLDLPIVLYEAWAADSQHAEARTAWQALSELDRAELRFHGVDQGYLGSTVVLIPQKLRAFFRGVETVCVAHNGDPIDEPAPIVVSEVFDGQVVLSRKSILLCAEEARALGTAEVSRYARLHRCGGTFAEMNATGDGDPAELALHSEDAHGLSGSDWRLTLVGSDGQCDSATVGLIRGFGSRYVTAEPWRDRAPHLGFSAPALVSHVAPGDDLDVVVRTLKQAGRPLSICDPYADTASLGKLTGALRGGRILTRAKGVESRFQKHWLNANSIELRTKSDLHDRIVIGSQRAFLVGGSLNGLGKTHCFVTTLDNSMRAHVCSVFDELWEQSSSWPALK